MTWALGPIAFAAPLALIGLLALPVIWRLLRAAPPAPRRTPFAPLRLLLGLEADENTQERTPWWLVVLRLLVAALVIFGLARPILFPNQDSDGAGPLILAVDDGWASAGDWDRRQAAALALIDAAGRDGREVILVLTAPDASPLDVRAADAADARRALSNAEPKAWAPDRAATAAALAAARDAGRVPRAASSVWYSDGLDHGDAAAFARALAAFGNGKVYAPPARAAALGLRPPVAETNGFSATVVRARGDGPRDGSVSALDADGRALGRAPFAFEADATRAVAALELPLELRNRLALLRVEGAAGAGAAQVLDDRWRRPSVGLATSSAAPDRQPLLADLHYVEQALAPFAEVRRASLARLVSEKPGAIVLTDAGRVVGEEADDLARYVADGGLLIRFAGPRLAARADDMTPVRLRTGDRALGGALAWDEPQTLAAFAERSPFYGLAAPAEVTVSRQVLAEPTPDLGEKTWARLADGTPLVTSERRGRGRIVLFHVTASPEWSSLPLSGLFEQMLRRVAAFADAGPAGEASADGVWRLERALTADGRLSSRTLDVAPLSPPELDAAIPGPDAPPGVWRSGPAAHALNLLDASGTLAPLPALPGGLTLVESASRAPRALAGPLLGIALALLTLDAIAVFALSGRAVNFTRRAGATSAALLVAVAVAAAFTPRPASAQDPVDDAFALAALEELRLAYVITGDADTDEVSRAGLEGLSLTLRRRTSIEPGAPIGVNLESDEINLLPMLYWPVAADTPAPSPHAAAKLDSFLKSGGVIVFDTRDAPTAATRGTSPHPGLARIVEAIDIPPLAEVPQDHVLTKAFYLMQEFPGRWRDAPVWVEADGLGSSRDGVSSVIVGSADWAAAWAIDASGQPLVAVTPGGPRQREFAYRFGVNLVMYVLTGNYKADQVHVPALLERLGQ